MVLISSDFAGAEIITFLAPALICFSASSRVVKCPVDSITTSIFNSFHGSSSGFLAAKHKIVLSPIRIDLLPAFTASG